MTKLGKDLKLDDVLFSIRKTRDLGEGFYEFTTISTIVDEVRSEGKNKENVMINGEIIIPKNGKIRSLPTSRNSFNEDEIFTDEDVALKHIRKYIEFEHTAISEKIEELTKIKKQIEALKALYDKKEYLVDPKNSDREITIDMTEKVL